MDRDENRRGCPQTFPQPWSTCGPQAADFVFKLAEQRLCSGRSRGAARLCQSPPTRFLRGRTWRSIGTVQFCSWPCFENWSYFPTASRTSFIHWYFWFWKNYFITICCLDEWLIGFSSESSQKIHCWKLWWWSSKCAQKSWMQREVWHFCREF